MKLGKIIGVGNTARVYDWDEGRVLKLFSQGYPSGAVEKEFNNAMAINDLNFAKPKAYEIISFEGQKGIIYDKVEGESLLEWVLKTGNIQECAIYMANLHKEIVKNKVSSITSYKDFLRHHISNSALTFEKQEEVFNKIDKLPEGDTLCHGDYHPGNILILRGHSYIIDFMNMCHGDILYDIARTAYLIEYTPVPADINDRETILCFKKSLTDLYLEQMNVTREKIQDFLSVITIARKGECPNE